MAIGDHPNVKATLEDEGPSEVDLTEDLVRRKILHLFSIFPKLSPSMIQVGIGTSLPPTLWRPIADELVKEGKLTRTIEQHTTPSDRWQSYTIYALAYTPDV